jgi:hypothetical protein
LVPMRSVFAIGQFSGLTHLGMRPRFDQQKKRPHRVIRRAESLPGYEAEALVSLDPLGR